MSCWRRSIVLLSVCLMILLGCAGKQKKGSGLPGKTEGGSEGAAAHAEAAKESEDGQTVSGEVAGGHVMSEDAKGIYNDGVRKAMAGSLNEAEQAFKRVLQIDGNAYQAAYNLGVVAERKGDDVAAERYYRQAIGVQSNFVPAVAAYANLEIRRGNTNAALEFLKKTNQEYPLNPFILNIYADVLIAARRYDDAISQAKKVLKMDERNADAMLRIGKANVKLGRNELALAILNQVLKIKPNEAEAHFLKAEIRAEEGQRAVAIQELKSAIEKRPNYVEAMNNLASLYLISGNYNLAVELLSRAVGLSPSWALLHLNLGNALRGAKQWKASKEATMKALSLSPQLIGGIFNLGLLYYTANELDNMDRLARLKEAKRLFARYKKEKGASLKNKDSVHKYIKEVETAIEREETRIARTKEREAAEAERAKEREAKKKVEAAPEDTPKKDVGEGKDADKSGGDEAGADDGWF